MKYVNYGSLAWILACAPAVAQDQLRFSIDLGSASVGTLGSDGSVLVPASVLSPTLEPLALGPLPPPHTLYLPGALGLVGGGPKEMDAMSHGRDARPNGGVAPGQLLFSVDRNAQAIGPAAWANVNNEFPQAASDAYVNVAGMPAVPADPSVIAHHAAVIDGNGLAHPLSGYKRGGLGIAEIGDAIDGIDQVQGVGGALNQLFFSLAPVTAAAHGQNPGDVLHSGLGGGFALYLSASSLGLDQAGVGTDDVDALAVWDDNDGFYEPPATVNNPETPYIWGPGEGDMVLFSVTSTSAVVGQPDSHFGLPIQPGDVLTIPEPGSPYGGFPAIVVAAERIYLRTDRGGLLVMDDLDALDFVFEPSFDCNGNGLEDGVDIAMGTATDANLNGYPDSCEDATSYCTAGTSVHGCTATLSESGHASATASSGFLVTATNMNGNRAGLLFFSPNGGMAAPYGCTSSFSCVVPPVTRTPSFTSSGATGGCGDASRDLNADWCPTCPKSGKNPGAGTTIYVQAWYRDPLNTCFTKTALSDALEVLVLP